MKRLIYPLLHVLAFIVFFASCKEDLGNYDYHEINEVTIGGIQETYDAFTGRPISIRPELTFTQDPTGAEADYSYEWISMQDGATNVTVRRLLSTSKNLDTILTLPAANYTIYYRVTEKATGIQWRKVFRMHVTSEIRDGWLVLNDVNDEARLDMLVYHTESETFQPYIDILSSTSSGVKLRGKPLFVTFFQNRDVFNNAFTNRIYIGTDSATHSINVQVFTWDNHRNLRSEVMRPVPDDYHAVKLVPIGANQINYLLDSEGVVTYENITQAIMYGPTINRLNTGARIRVSPHIVGHYRSAGYLVMYDMDLRRFLVHSGTNRVSLIPTANPADVFDPADMGLDLRFLSFTTALGGHYVAVMKDPNSDRHYLLRFARASTSVFTPLTFDELVEAPEIARAERFAVDPQEAYLFYQVDSKVYQYDPFSKTTRLMLDVGNRKISVLKYYQTTVSHSNARYMEYARKLIVCTYDEQNPTSSGKMELFNVPNLNQPLTLFQSFDGFGKIADVSYRE